MKLSDLVDTSTMMNNGNGEVLLGSLANKLSTGSWDGGFTILSNVAWTLNGENVTLTGGSAAEVNCSNLNMTYEGSFANVTISFRMAWTGYDDMTLNFNATLTKIA